MRAPDPSALDRVVDETVRDRALVGLAVGVVANGQTVYRRTVGQADTRSAQSVSPTTLFRLASVTKTMTAIAVMQLVEQGRISLDDPVNAYLTGFRVERTDANAAPVLVRHLLTHTAGLTEPLRRRDLLSPSRVLGPKRGRPVPSLTSLYAPVMRPAFAPGASWMYSNDGFAALGQLVEDVVGRPFAEHVTDEVLHPLGMRQTTFSPAPGDRVAMGHRVKRSRVKQTTPRSIANLPAGGAYSTLEDMLRYATELTGVGPNLHPHVLTSQTLAEMYQPAVLLGDRIPFQGLCFLLDEEDGHRTVSHGGDYPGYEAALLVAPDDDMGVVVLSNSSARGAAQRLSRLVLRQALGLADHLTVRHPEAELRADLVPELTGRYRAGRGSRNLRLLAMTGGRLTVGDADGRLSLRGRFGPLRRRVPLEPADPGDALRFRFMLRGFLYDQVPVDVVFTRDADGRIRRLDLGLIGARMHRR
jgi:CubicO group peptidase (beta-lactamase class C family)